MSATRNKPTCGLCGDRAHFDFVPNSVAHEWLRRAEDAEERLRLNADRLNRAVASVPGFRGFNGTPESSVGMAATIVERYADRGPLTPVGRVYRRVRGAFSS